MTVKGSYLIIGSGGTADPTSVMSHWAQERGKTAATPSLEEIVVKYHSRPSTQYRYEHYDPYGEA
jgi:hypothetical protein